LAGVEVSRDVEVACPACEAAVWYVDGVLEHRDRDRSCGLEGAHAELVVCFCQDERARHLPVTCRACRGYGHTLEVTP
jgi:hypothetical protein